VTELTSTMQDGALTITGLLRHSERVFAASVVRTYEGERVREATYAEVGERAARLAGALRDLGVGRETASARSRGTPRSTLRPTSACRPWGRYCTP